MPAVPAHSYPGVYIQEVPGGVHTIIGVATSITAFLGRASRGPVNEPVTINSYADFERIFGGVWPQSALGTVVQDFYLNGGSQAIVVRLFNAGTPLPQPTVTVTPAEEKGPAKGKASASAEQSPAPSSTAVQAPARSNALLHVNNSLPLEAKYPGSWGNNLRARIDPSTAQNALQRYGLSNEKLFTLSVRDMSTGQQETFRDLSVETGPRLVTTILASASQLVRIPDGAPLTLPPPQTATPPKGASIWESDGTSTGVATTDQATDGVDITTDSFVGVDTQSTKTGLYALERVDLFNLLSIPPYGGGHVDAQLVAEAAAYCEKRRAMLLVDPWDEWTSKDDAKSGVAQVGTTSANAMLFFPQLKRANSQDMYVPSGAVAGVIARTDTQRGVWKAPAGLIDGVLKGVSQLSVPLTNDENGELNPLAVNCLRTMPGAGPVIWGARTLQGNDDLGSEWKYIPVRRLALFIEESLYRGTQWAVFEPNDEPLWAQLRLNIGVFMHDLFRQGAFQGQKPQDAYFVQCDSTTTTQADIDQGIVNILVGFAPLKPAEFVILSIQQLTGQLAV